MLDATECSGLIPVDPSLRSQTVEFMHAYIDEYNMLNQGKYMYRRAASVAMSYLDRLLSNETPGAIILLLRDKRRYWLAATACLYIALEVNILASEVYDSFLCSFLGGSFLSDINREKFRVLHALEWRLNGPVANDYVGLFLGFVQGNKMDADAIFCVNPSQRADEDTNEWRSRLQRMEEEEETQRVRQSQCSEIAQKAHEQIELFFADHLLIDMKPSVIAMVALRTAVEEASNSTDSLDMWGGAVTCFGILSGIDLRSDQLSFVQKRLGEMKLTRPRETRIRLNGTVTRITLQTDGKRKTELDVTSSTFGTVPEPVGDKNRKKKKDKEKDKEKEKRKKERPTKRRHAGMQTGGRISQHRLHPREDQRWADMTDEFGYDGSRPFLPWMELPSDNYVCGYGKAFDLPYLNRELDKIGRKYPNSDWQRMLRRNGCDDDHPSPRGARQRFDLLKKLRWAEKKAVDGAI